MRDEDKAALNTKKRDKNGHKTVNRMYKTVEQCQHYQRELGNGHFEIRVRAVCLAVCLSVCILGREKQCQPRINDLKADIARQRANSCLQPRLQ
jgi:hypothetical protein